MIEHWMQRHERWMYRSGRPNPMAAFLNRLWAIAGKAGIWRSRLVTLQVAGRSSGRAISFPLVVVRQGGERYLVAMLGERAQWVRNVRASGGSAVLWDGGRRQAVDLEDVDTARRPPIIKRYVELAPGGASFVPVDRRADVAAFEDVAADFPVFRVRGRTAGSDVAPAARPRRRRRWIVGGVLALVAIVAVVVGGIGAYLRTSAEPPLGLPAAAAPAEGPLGGTWAVSGGSVAGFRIRQTVIGLTGDVVGRTTAVTGSATVANDGVAAATFQVDLRKVTANGKPSAQFDQTLDTPAYPDATFTLTRTIAIDPGFGSGALLQTNATGDFTLHGVTRRVTALISARRTGSSIDATGSIPVTFADYGIRTPAGYGWLGSLADRGVAEFLLVLVRAS